MRTLSDEEMAASICTGMRLLSLTAEQMVTPDESEWFWGKVREFSKGKNLDPIGSVVREFKLWPNPSTDESRGSSVVSQASVPTEVDSGASQVLQSVLF